MQYFNYTKLPHHKYPGTRSSGGRGGHLISETNVMRMQTLYPLGLAGWLAGVGSGENKKAPRPTDFHDHELFV